MIELNGANAEQVISNHNNYNDKEKNVWPAFMAWDKLFLVLIIISGAFFLAALFVLLTPLLDSVLDFMGLHYTGWDEWKAWIMGSDRGLVMGVSLGLIALLFALLARYRILRDYNVYVEAGCPQCDENELVRVRRNRRDRALGTFGLPVRRYSCRNCTWHGVRLAGYHQRSTIEDPAGSEFEQTEPAVEIDEETLAFTEMNMEVDAELVVQDGGAGSIWAEETTEITKQAYDVGEEEAANSSGSDEELVSLYNVDEDAGVVEVEEDEAVKEQLVEDPTAEIHEQEIELESDGEVEDAVRDATEDDEADDDDDFARLCHEVVARSK